MKFIYTYLETYENLITISWYLLKVIQKQLKSTYNRTLIFFKPLAGIFPPDNVDTLLWRWLSFPSLLWIESEDVGVFVMQLCKLNIVVNNDMITRQIKTHVTEIPY